MRSLEQYISSHLLQSALLKQIDIEGLVEVDNELWLVFTHKTKNERSYKVNLKNVIWGPLDKVYECYVWTEMLREGYVLVDIEGGSLVISPKGEEHQLGEDTCTCEHFVFTKQRCKHLVFRDAHLSYRGRQIELRNDISTNI
jgi:hypothetical protein